jgi:hypothetical protein
MSAYSDILVERYRNQGLLIDSNLALLYLIGLYNVGLVGDAKYKKLAKYGQEEFDILLRLKEAFSKAVTTPHVLTEVSNLANDLPEQTKAACLRKFHETFAEIDELSIPSMDAAQRPEFPFLGLTDSALAIVSRQYLIVTDDARFVKKLNESGLEALNFNHLR